MRVRVRVRSAVEQLLQLEDPIDEGLPDNDRMGPRAGEHEGHLGPKAGIRLAIMRGPWPRAGGFRQKPGT